MARLGFEVGIASGAWQEAAQATFGKSSGGKVGDSVYNILTTQTYTRNGETRFSVTHSVKDRQWRVVLFDRENTMHQPIKNLSNGINGMTQTEFTLRDIAPEEVERIELQVRDYEWQKFEGISVNPNDGGSPSAQPREVSSNAPAESVTPDAKASYEAAYAGGFRASIIAVGDPTGFPTGRTWTPDGSRLPEAPSVARTSGGPSSYSSNDTLRRFFFELALPSAESDLSLRLRIQEKEDELNVRLKEGGSSVALSLILPTNETTVPLELGLAAGPWETLLDLDPRAEGITGPMRVRNLKITSNQVENADQGSTYIDLTHDPMDRASRLLIVTTDGRELPARLLDGERDGGGFHARHVLHPAIGADDIAEIRFQARDFEWKTFRAISVHPTVPRETGPTRLSAALWNAVISPALAKELIASSTEVPLHNTKDGPRRPKHKHYESDTARLASQIEEARASGAVLAVNPDLLWVECNSGESSTISSHDISHHQILDSMIIFHVGVDCVWTREGDDNQIDFKANYNTDVMPSQASGRSTRTGDVVYLQGTLQAGRSHFFLGPMAGLDEERPWHLIGVDPIEFNEAQTAILHAETDANRWIDQGPEDLLLRMEGVQDWVATAGSLKSRARTAHQPGAWTKASDELPDLPENGFAPISLVCVGQPSQWPHYWWDMDGAPVNPNPVWQSDAASATIRMVVKHPAEFTGQYFIRKNGGAVSERMSATHNDVDDETLLTWSATDGEGEPAKNGDLVTLVARMGYGDWSEVARIQPGETVEAEGGIFRLSIEEGSHGEDSAESDISRRLLEGTADFDPAWAIALMKVDLVGDRTSFARGAHYNCSDQRKNRALGSDVLPRPEEVSHFVIVKRPIAEFVIADIPVGPEAVSIIPK